MTEPITPQTIVADACGLIAAFERGDDTGMAFLIEQIGADVPEGSDAGVWRIDMLAEVLGATAGLAALGFAAVADLTGAPRDRVMQDTAAFLASYFTGTTDEDWQGDENA